MNGDQLASSPHLARALVFVGGIIHSVGSHLLKQQNDDLTGQVSHARAETTLLIHRAYALGRRHQAVADPGPHPADLADTVRALGDVDEHQDDAAVAAAAHDASPSSTATHPRADASAGTGATDSARATTAVPRAGNDASAAARVTPAADTTARNAG